jgi:hypothetical protein
VASSGRLIWNAVHDLPGKGYLGLVGWFGGG